MQTRSGLVESEVIILVKRLDHEYHSTALARPTSRVVALAMYGAQNGEDPQGPSSKHRNVSSLIIANGMVAVGMGSADANDPAAKYNGTTICRPLRPRHRHRHP